MIAYPQYNPPRTLSINHSNPKQRELRTLYRYFLASGSIPCGIGENCGQGTNYLISNWLKVTESPLNTSKSTGESTPFTRPLSLCCQNTQSLLIRGCRG